MWGVAEASHPACRRRGWRTGLRWLATARDNSARNWHVDGDWACVGFSLEEERVMQHRSGKYFPQFENQGIDPGGSRQVQSTCANTKELAPNAIKGLSIPSRLIAK